MENNSNKQAIHNFANEWLKKFQADKRQVWQIFDDVKFSDECFKLGFQMDCGNSFTEQYGQEALSDLEKLQGIIDNVTDIQLIGNALFSQWRYFNHWSYSPPEAKDIKWFVILFLKLKELTK